MKEDDGSSRYSATNEIMNPDHAADVGIFEPPNSDVNGSNAAQGQVSGRGKKPQGGGTSQSNCYENTACGSSSAQGQGGSTKQSTISKKEITAPKGSSYVGKFNFDNVNINAGQAEGDSEGNKGFHKNKGICHNMHRNKITANKSTNVGFENFGNSNINFKSTSTKNHGKAAGGSSSAQGQGRSTNESIISNNEITAKYQSSNVGMLNFHNVNINAGQAEGGCEGNEGFHKNEGISHDIYKNTIIAVNSRKVGIQNFGNIKYNCKNIIRRLLRFLGLS
ncbi:PREDICTED: uncharacterized protein LOC103342997 [Prunus mume]|uniref:Uncharacterized protein LOC103342997 n=1 Tax=Prunus mume TaxID=102107 RepID=A0ABM0PUZ9_PRUMU|nr:PREDICTED: uncharacterized protein LOC103342997 [Prunus mume]